METRKLAVALIAILNSASAELERLVSEDGDADDDEPKKEATRKRPPSKNKPDEDDLPSKDAVIDAVRAAQKVVSVKDIKKILQKFGGAERASDVEPGDREAVIEALAEVVAKEEEE